jgi:adenylate cyclase
MGAEDFLPKPVDEVLLRARIGATLEKKRLRDQEILHQQQIEHERARADVLLHAIFPDEIARELKAQNRVEPRRHDNVAVLFADIVGFTPYCETHPAQEVVAQLQALTEAYEDIALRYGVQKIKTIGDAFMAASGLLRPVENPVVSCIRSGEEMIATAKRLPPNWSVRVGIHVGPVVAGVLGRRQYLFDLWGDTVNTAARVQAYGSPDSIALTRAARDQAKAHASFQSLGTLKVKGKGAMEIFRFLAFTEKVRR